MKKRIYKPKTLPKKLVNIYESSERFDGWANIASGLGTSADKRMASQVLWSNNSLEFYEQLYTGDELASKIVNVIPEECLRKFIEWSKLMEKDVQIACTDIIQKLDLRATVERTWKWARAYGGACLYVVTDTNFPDLPFNPATEKVVALRDLSRYDLRIMSTDVETDFGSANFGKPNMYYLMVQMGSDFKGYPIHASRMVRFDGQLVPRRTYIRNNYWNDSVLNRLYNAIRNYQTSNDAAASILQDFNVGVFKMKNLHGMIGAGQDATVIKRLNMVQYAKSTIRSMIIDADNEEYTDVTRNVTGLPEMLSQQANRLVAATDIPHTKLLGESPDGSNATGNSTTSQWFDVVQSEQENTLRPKLKQLFSMIFPNIPDLDFTFKKLWQLDEKEEAELRNKQAQTDQIYVGMGALDPSEVTESRFGGDEYSTETKLDLEGREAGLIGAFNNEPVDGDPGFDDGGSPGAPSSDGPNGGEPSDADPADAATQGDPKTGPAPYVPSGANKSKNEGNQGPTGKSTPTIGISMSEPMRDPKYDKPLKAPGRPNKPRTITK